MDEYGKMDCSLHKSRHEKVVIQELEKKNIEAYCPNLKKDGSGR
ncbi:MAG: hypothetical protein CM1200mP10_16990 [Candidatus Neomarinimicrobiota bacterium]|nr:MAG: hypothetical protein CM1200mP10_16990 [Candidatus Neomarinimicrobiota bacterium]